MCGTSVASLGRVLNRTTKGPAFHARKLSHMDRHRPLARSGPASATLLQSAVCKTNAVPRPCPTLFYFPGLHARPVWSRQDSISAFPWLVDMEKEENVAAMRREYAALVQDGVVSDYSTKDPNRAGGEHKMHAGDGCSLRLLRSSWPFTFEQNSLNP